MKRLIPAGILLISLPCSAAIDCPPQTHSTTAKEERGSIEQCVSDSDQQPEGPRIDYDTNGVKRRDWRFHRGAANGPFTVYSADARKLREGAFADGRLDGLVRRWYPNSQLQDETEWLNGRPQGKSNSYYENGKPREEGRYRSGRRVGAWKTWREDGSLIEEKNFGSVRRSFAAGWKAKLTVSGPAAATAAWPTDSDVEIQELREGEFEYVALVQARFSDKGWQLVSGSDWHPAWDPEERTAAFSVPLTSADTRHDVYAIGPEGSVQRYRIQLEASDFPVRQKALVERPPVHSYFLAAAGPTSISYTEGSLASFKTLALGARIVYRNTILPPRIDVSVSGYYSGIPLSHSGVVDPAKFLGLNARIGYIVPGLGDPWSLSLMAGAYFTTTFVTGDAYGYKNLFGPQLYPYLSRRFGRSDLGFAYFKYSPISENLNFLNLLDRELAVGGGWIRTLDSGARIGLLLDYSTLKIEEAGIRLHSDAVGLSFAYGL